ncbi:hypothetical protein SpCBS45565_g01777 [Spizellomyces sp. 'palustris']|nr:hypothetical protein SpCBS45565_g01777 [Spizellomyces sp. 'palustris']
MDKADSDFLHQLFRENNELRAKFNALQRELYNKAVQNETMEEEIRQLKLRLEEGKTTPSRPTTQGGHVRKGARITNDSVASPSTPNAAKDLSEALFTLERKSAELKQVREDLAKNQSMYEEEVAKTEDLKRQMTDVQEELHDLRQFRATALKDAENAAKKEVQVAVPDDIMDLQEKLEDANATIHQQKRQIVDIAADANRRHNEQQNQLQGVEALIEGIRREYDEFIEVTKLENEAYQKVQQEEYERLRDEYENHKREQFEDKKRLMTEYQGLLYSMQGQFDEYRMTAEFLFNAEVAKLEDELSSQAARYEQEIMYVIQAKDKFYADMMVAKDAKIMNLIEGSDLQNLMQKHEMDMENIRKEHAREIERVKSDQESEQKHLVSLLQRQNVSLESKCDKLQTHLKSLETRIKDLMATIEVKNKMISDREEARLRAETDNQRKLDDMTARINVLAQEKEHLRHKVIRLALDAKGEGHNSIENMLKRISRETNELRFDYEGMSVKYDSMLSENQLLSKRLKEREKFVDFLEKEVARRTEEFQNMTRTFEDFLAARARQSRRERAKRLMKLHGSLKCALLIGFAKTEQCQSGVALEDEGVWTKSQQEGVPPGYMDAKGLLKARVPEREGASLSAVHMPLEVEKETRKAELERGYAYLRRFKTLSRAFATGDFRIIPNGEPTTSTEGMPGTWQKTALYAKLEDANITLARLYKEPPREDVTKQLPHPKPLVYIPEGDPNAVARPQVKDPKVLKIYDDAERGAAPPKKRPKSGEIKTLQKLFAGKEIRHQLNGLKIFSKYLEDMVKNKVRRNINIENKAFSSWIGYNEHSSFIFSQLGYVYDSITRHFIPQELPEGDNRLQFAYQEVQFQRWKKEGPPGPNDDWLNFTCATVSVCSIIGSKFQADAGSDIVARLKSLNTDSNGDLTKHHQTLGLTRDATDTSIKNIQWMYSILQREDPKGLPMYLHAVAEIAQARNSNDLQELVVVERSKGIPYEAEVQAAYAMFGLVKDASDDMVIIAYARAATNQPQKERELKEALKSIAIARDSSVLQHFLETGQHFVQEAAPMGVSVKDLPAGMQNIGNTCYLNSLLQLYFTIRPLRDAVIDFKPEIFSGEQEQKRQRSAEFVQQLQSLFTDLIWTDTASVEPPKRLAEIALNNENLFGQQQDIGESMDNILDLLETALVAFDVQTNLVKRLFFGKTKQTLRYSNPTGEPNTSCKSEEFSHLIVEVKEDLYTALDAYFETTQVDLEGKEAQKELFILEAPPILTVQIRRVKYDREKKQAYKSNEYLRYHKTIYLDRYHAECREGRVGNHVLGDNPMEHDGDNDPTAQDDGVSGQATMLPNQENGLQTDIGEVTSSADMNQLEYKLHAVFIHLGEASFGHYWIYIYDEENDRWLKFDDSVVSKVSESDVFSDTTGSTANAYALIYVKVTDAKQILNAYARSPKMRAHYLERFSGVSSPR